MLEYLSNFTLLYVEDDTETRLNMEKLLRGNVKELFVASNGKEGLDLFIEKDPDIVLSDITMPVMNGLEMSQNIKAINPYKPIALLTAFNEPEYLKQAINMGVDKYIVKPIKRASLFNTLESIAKLLQTDIDKKNVERILQTQSKVAAMGEMIGNIAHQWRQPLSIISTLVSGLKIQLEYGELNDSKIIECANKVLNQTTYLSQTIDDFKNFFSDEHNNKKEFNLNKSIQKILSLTNDMFKNNFISVVVNINSDCKIIQNENQFIQALINIFNNAKDAFVLNEIEYERYFFIDINNDSKNIIITIKDNAKGIKDEIIDKIFEPYFTTKHQYFGTGIGLYMTNQIITKHFGGVITASNITFDYNNTAFRGAQFQILLPLAK